MIVCIGASAGGLDPIIQIIQNLGTEQEEHAFVIIQHLAKDKKSHMQDILTPKTNFKVKVIEDHMPIEKGVIYLSPPGVSVSILEQRFSLQPIEMNLSQRTIDNFFTSAANNFKASCLGVILSGSGSDGQKGCQEIFDMGGEVFVQDPEEAEFTGMPETVIRAGCFTKIIKIDSFNVALDSISKEMELPEDLKFFDLANVQFDRLNSILAKNHNVSLKDYKKPTIIRRFIKRIKYLGYEKVEDYLNFLESDQNESDILFSELMINVTDFFRDNHFYESLKQIIETEFKHKTDLRVWSCGCSKGQEVFSILITILEAFKEAAEVNVKIFATDINPQNIDYASRAIYTPSELKEIPPQLLSKYFEKINSNYKVKDHLRKMVVFSEHDVVNSTPFSNIDLTVCRNLLIYLNPIAQSRAITNLVFSNRMGGLFAIGPSENLGVLTKYYVEVDRKWKIFKKLSSGRIMNDYSWKNIVTHGGSAGKSISVPRTEYEKSFAIDLLESLYPNSLIIDEYNSLLAIFGKAEGLIAKPSGVFSNSIDSLINRDTNIPLSAILLSAKEDGSAVLYKDAYLMVDGEKKFVDLTIEHRKIREDSGLFICHFDDFKSKGTIREIDSSNYDQIIEKISAELEQTKKGLVSKNYQLDKLSEELQTSNEELIASNEELQSTNEELNSVNEELYTLNNELQYKVEELTTSNSDLKNLIDSARFGVIFLDSQLRLRNFTKNITENFYVRTNDIGRKIFELDFGTYISKFESELINNKFFSVTLTILSKDNLYYELSIRPYQSLTGAPQGFLITLNNIDALKRNELFLEITQKDALIGGWFLDLSTQVTTWSKQVYDIYGIEGEIPTNYEIGIDSYVEPDRSKLVKLIEDCAKGSSFSDTFNFKSLDGKRKIVRVTGKPIYSETGKIVSLRGTIQDITALQNLQDRTEYALSCAKTGIWDWNLIDQALFWDTMMYDIFEIERHSEVNNYSLWMSALHPEDKNQVLSEVNLAIQGIKNFDIYYRIKTPNGEVKHIHSRANIIRDEKGAAIRMIGASVDSTELRNKEQELKRQHRIANQSAKLAQIGEMAAGIGHEINNPLSVGMGSLELLAEGLTNSSEGALKNISRIRDSFNRIAKIVAQLRLFSRMETIETSRPFNYMEVIKESVELMELRLKNIKIEFSCDETASKMAFGNSSSLSQVLINLLGNAIDALQESDKKMIKISCVMANDNIVISVRDYGPGIPDAIKDQIFDHFFTTKPKGKGTGIGLSLSKDLMQQMGGDLELDEKVKDGACFKITLRSGVNKVVSPAQPKKQIASKARVLLLDDEEQLVEVLGLQIQMLGCEVFATTDYKKAIEKAMSDKFDVIISDMNMGEFNGKDFLLELMKSGKYQKHQLNIISGGLPKIQLMEIQNLFNKVLFKPVEKMSLVEIIDQGLAAVE